MPGKSDYLETSVLNSTLRGVAFPVPTTGSNFVSLHTADPLDAGTGVEVTGGAYARVAVSRVTASAAFGAPVDNAGSMRTSNVAAVTFPNPTAAWGTVTHFGVFDAVTLGNLMYSGVIGTSRAIAAGDTAPSFAAGTLTIDEG
ncbi:MAG TPA: hypothetical protein VNJ04_19745 [Gemmatimonadaceae bacterium]|nr:hypothetical protein [Gemmatimonadaceae bacterium]